MTVQRICRAWSVAIVALVFAASVIVHASPAHAAAKPTIASVALYGGSEFRAVSAIVWGATGVVVCVSGKCVKAFKQRAGLWTAPASGLPALRRGQRRQVVVFAANSTGQFAYATTQAVVR